MPLVGGQPIGFGRNLKNGMGASVCLRMTNESRTTGEPQMDGVVWMAWESRYRLNLFAVLKFPSWGCGTEMASKTVSRTGTPEKTMAMRPWLRSRRLAGPAVILCGVAHCLIWIYINIT